MERRTWRRLDILIIVIVQLIASLSSVTAQDYYRIPGTNKCTAVFDSIELNWYTARDYCQGLSGELAKITSPEEQLFYDALVVNTTLSIWTQVTDLGTETVFAYLDGQNVTFTNWLPGQPDHLPSHDCVRATAYQHWVSPPVYLDTALWTDIFCTNQHQFACDVPAHLVNGTCLNLDNVEYPDTTTVEPDTTTVEPDTTTVEPSTDPPTTTEESIITTEPFTIRLIVPTPAASEQSALTAVAAVTFIGVPLIVGSLIACRYCGFLAGCKRRKRSVGDEDRQNEDEA